MRFLRAALTELGEDVSVLRGRGENFNPFECDSSHLDLFSFFAFSCCGNCREILLSLESVSAKWRRMGRRCECGRDLPFAAPVEGSRSDCDRS